MATIAAGAHRPAGRARPVLLAGFALLAFAANSLLCRVALARGLIDPAGFTLLRMVAGALMLTLLLHLRLARGGRWSGAGLGS
ncbi:hypothetical protein [Derxia gummosa]|uniref:EamA domain-containing protein n=1 Tax=Derxia gummosa DSM 723 TaxID=1121388 RepID=A0A8B6XDE2_9BURK|nr:hypothetical protein [Derxia gummosa]